MPVVRELLRGRWVEAVPLAEGERPERDVLDVHPRAGQFHRRARVLLVHRERRERVQHELERRRLRSFEVIVQDQDVRFHEDHIPPETLQPARVGVGRVACHVIPLLRQTLVDDPPVRRGRVLDLALAVDEHGVLGDGAVRPLVMELAPVQVAVRAGDEQRLAVGVQLERIVRVVPVALRAEGARLEEKMHVVLAAEQRRVQACDADAAEDPGLREVGGRLGVGERRQVGRGEKTGYAALAPHLPLRGPPAPVRRLRAVRLRALGSNEVLHESADPRGRRAVGEVAEAHVRRAGRRDVERVVADLREERLLEAVDAQGTPGHVQPRDRLAHVAGPVADALVPAAVVVRPDGVAPVELVDGVVEPRLGLGDLAEERDAGLADLVPDAVRMAAVGAVEMPGAAPHFAAFPGVLEAPRRHLPHELTVLRRQGVPGPVVRARGAVEHHLAGLAVHPEVRRAVGVPGGEMHDPLPRRFRVLLLAGHQVDERDRLGLGAGLVRLHAVGPPVLDQFRVLLVARRAHVRGLGRRPCGDARVGLGPQLLEARRFPAFRELPQPRQILGAQEEARPAGRDALALLGPRRHRELDGIGGHDDAARSAPLGFRAVLGGEAIAPPVGSRRERRIVRVGVPGEAAHRHCVGEVLPARPLDRVRRGGAFVEPDEGRRVEPDRLAVGRPVTHLAGLRRPVVDGEPAAGGGRARLTAEDQRKSRRRENA